MQEEPFPAADRILTEIEAVFKRDPKLKEFDIVPVTENQNKSPVLHVEHCLGLESWCVRHVYCYAYHRLMDARQLRNRREDPSTLSRLLSGALLLNPDVATFWNMRREVVQSSQLNARLELHFTAVLLSRKPKCAEAFAHRKWVLGRLLLDDPNVNELLEEELRISQYAADRYPNNYHAWSYRMWCLSHLGALIPSLLQVYLKELSASEIWISSHVSDHSGMQYRQFLLKKLFKAFASSTNGSWTSTAAEKELKENTRKSLHQFFHPLNGKQLNMLGNSCLDGNGKVTTSSISGESRSFELKSLQSIVEMYNLPSLTSCIGLIAHELQMNSDLIVRFMGHEALWYHRRFLLSSFQKLLSPNEDGSNTFKAHIKRWQCCTGSHQNLVSNIAKCQDSGCHMQMQKTRAKEGSMQYVNDMNGGYFSSSGSLVEMENGKGNNHMGRDGIPLEKDQKMIMCNESSEESERREFLRRILVGHEEQLLEKCPPKTGHQHHLATQHTTWLSRVLAINLKYQGL